MRERNDSTWRGGPDNKKARSSVSEHKGEGVETSNEEDGAFDVGVYDPPHVPNQGKDRRKDFNARFGLVLKSGRESGYSLSHLYPPFAAEAYRVLAPEGVLLCKVADIACGSGAFLVSAARYLADRVVEAWITEDTTNAKRRDLHLRAIREVVANCLYGADINDMAVEMCKLSLWLVSLDRDLPSSSHKSRIIQLLITTRATPPIYWSRVIKLAVIIN